MLTPRSGTIRVGGVDVTRHGPQDMIRNGLSHVLQGHSVFKEMTVAENVQLGAYTVRDKALIDERVDFVKTLFPVVAERWDALAGALSGGQQKQVEFARSLMVSPRVVLLDEPSMGLDPKTTSKVFEQIVRMRDAGIAVLLVEQNARRALETADVGCVLDLGRVHITGPARGAAGRSAARRALPRRPTHIRDERGDRTPMTDRTLRIIMNGVTGRMGHRQHLVRSVLAIRDEGGIERPDGSRLQVEPVLVGRNRDKLADLADRYGIAEITTDLDEALSDDTAEVYFDALVTTERKKSILKALAAGKHVYTEKPLAESVGEGLEIAEAGAAAGTVNGVVHDKIFLPGLVKLKRLVDCGLLRPDPVGARRVRLLGVRGRLDRLPSGRAGTTGPRTAAGWSWTCSVTGTTCSSTSSAGSTR